MKTLLDAERLRLGVERMADQIHTAAGDRPITMIGILTGSIVLLADLIRLMNMPLRVGVVQASSYRGGTQRGELVINYDLMPDIVGRDVWLVDDIFDTGHTMVQVIRLMNKLGANSIRTAVLCRKDGRQEVDYVPDIVGFDIPDEFVVGYGLDYQDAYRNLTYLASMEPTDLALNEQDTLNSHND